MDFTLKHLYDLAVAEVGYSGSDEDWKAMKKALLEAKDEEGNPSPIDSCMWKGQKVDIASLTYQKADKRRGRTVTFIPSDAVDPDEAQDKFNAAVAAEVNKALEKSGRPKNNGRVDLEVKIGRTSDEMWYDAKKRCGQAVFKNFDNCLGFATTILAGTLQKMGRGTEADAIVKETQQKLTAKGYTLTTIGSGAATVPEGFDADLYQQLNEHSAARKSARVVPMSTETITRPKATGDLTVYYPADGSAGTESSKTWSNISMRAKTGVVIVKASQALTQDAAIGIADDAARDILRAIGKVEDNSLFNSNGSGATNGYIPGVQGILNIIGAGGAHGATAFVSTETSGTRVYNSASATGPIGVTLAEITGLMALPGNFVGRRMAFHGTQQMFCATLYRLAASVGGIQPMQIEGLGMINTFLGAPMIVNNVMSTDMTNVAAKQLLIYGDISLVADLGDRSGISIEVSDQRYWEENNIGIKGTIRHDINVHGCGTASTDVTPLAILLN